MNEFYLLRSWWRQQWRWAEQQTELTQQSTFTDNVRKLKQIPKSTESLTIHVLLAKTKNKSNTTQDT